MRSKEEALLQQECVKLFRKIYPKYSDIVKDKNEYKIVSLLQVSASGGSRNVREAKNIKMQGLCPGIPDLFLSIGNGDYNGLYVELKRPENKLKKQKAGALSVCQKKMHEMLREQGYKVEICYTANQFLEILENYLK